MNIVWELLRDAEMRALYFGLAGRIIAIAGLVWAAFWLFDARTAERPDGITHVTIEWSPPAQEFMRRLGLD